MLGALAAPRPADLLRARLEETPLPPGPAIGLPTVVFDLETTGLCPSRGDAIVQIGAVRLAEGGEVAAFSTLADPGRPVPATATRYHGLDDAALRGAPPVPQAVAAFRDFADGAVLVAHNAAFDLLCLMMAERAGAPAIRAPVLCSMTVARWLDPAEPDLSLDGLCGRMGVVIAGRHQALGDARATAALWTHLLARAAARGAEDLAALRHRSRMVARMAESAAQF